MKTTVTVLRCGFANAYLLRGQGGSVPVSTSSWKPAAPPGYG